MKVAFLKQVYFNLLSKLLHKINCFKKQFSILQLTKNVQNAAFWRKSTFFQKHIWLRNFFKGKMSSKSFFDQKKIKTQQKFHR